LPSPLRSLSWNVTMSLPPGRRSAELGLDHLPQGAEVLGARRSWQRGNVAAPERTRHRRGITGSALTICPNVTEVGARIRSVEAMLPSR